MCDRGIASELPTFPHADRMFTYTRPLPWVANQHGAWVNAVDVIDPLNAVAGSCGAVALGFLNRMCELCPDDEIGIVPTSFPGVKINAFNKWNRNTGSYGQVIERANWALDQCEGELSGMCFWQGEGNANTYADSFGTVVDGVYVNSWSECFSRFVSNVRVDMADLRLPVAFVRLGNTGNPAANWSTMRDQANWMTMKKLDMVNIDGITPLSDKTHYPTAGYVEIGIRIANAMAAL
jgi:hypothetical protein